MNEDIFTWNNLLFGIYPYVCLSVFAIGSWIRFDREQYGWTSASSQLLSTGGMRWASNLFHIGVLAIFGGHFVGLLTPHSVFLKVMGDIEHQYLAIVMGTIFGALALIGGLILLVRRFTNRRISATSRSSDKFVLVWVMATLVLGLSTIPVSIGHAGHGDPRVVTAMAEWIQSIMYLYPNPAYLEGVDTIFKMHVFFGMTVFLIFPFTRLVHIWSAPFGYLARSYQIVRSKKVKYQSR
ncbi:MAG: respiratory nitrate reductase subunit gamma [Nitrosomonadales bacterium]|nr:MAG: respiratory nitrate reductase subunit gamma [Nitrosomonadales bacterium]